MWDNIQSGKYDNKMPFGNSKDEFMAYNLETARLIELFAQDLFKDLGIENHPKKDKLFAMAYENGHSGGYSDIYSAALDLVDLIR